MSFYREVFGFELERRVDRKTSWLAAQVGYVDAHIEFAHMRGPDGMHLELLQYKHPKAEYGAHCDLFLPGNGHFAVFVDDAKAVFERVIEFMAKEGMRSSPRVKGNGWELETTRISDGPNEGTIAFYILDVDLHAVEVIQKP